MGDIFFGCWNVRDLIFRIEFIFLFPENNVIIVIVRWLSIDRRGNYSSTWTIGDGAHTGFG